MILPIIITAIEPAIATMITTIVIELESSELVVFMEEQVSFVRLKPFEH
jgi:hypothetical protein